MWSVKSITNKEWFGTLTEAREDLHLIINALTIVHVSSAQYTHKSTGSKSVAGTVPKAYRSNAGMPTPGPHPSYKQYH